MDISFNRYLFLKYFNNIVEIYVHNNGLHWFFKGKFHKPVKSNQVAHFLCLEKTPQAFLDLLYICHPSAVMTGSLTTWTINEVPWSYEILWFYFLEYHLIESQCLYQGTFEDIIFKKQQCISASITEWYDLVEFLIEKQLMCSAGQF